MLKAASKLTKLLPRQENDDVDIKTPLSLIKKTSNQQRRDIIKPTLPSQFVRIAELSDDFSTYFFGKPMIEKWMNQKKKVESNAF